MLFLLTPTSIDGYAMSEKPSPELTDKEAEAYHAKLTLRLSAESGGNERCFMWPTWLRLCAKRIDAQHSKARVRVFLMAVVLRRKHTICRLPLNRMSKTRRDPIRHDFGVHPVLVSDHES